MDSAHSPICPGGSSSHTSLQRGQACITCRRKKMRCDGARPYCGQCAMTRRPQDCEYTDRQGRTYTEILEERLNSLKTRIQELENPSRTNAPVYLHDPYAGPAATSQRHRRVASSEYQQDRNLSPVQPRSPVTASSDVRSHAPNRGLQSSDFTEMYQQLEVILRSPPSQPQPQPRLNNDHFQVLWVLEQIFGQSKNLTLQTHARFQVFLPHACRLGFALHIPTFLQSVALPQGHPSRPHPCLLDMISLWALRLSQSPDFIAHEPRYLSNALSTMPSALGSTNALHRIQFVQAEVLLALYFFCDGRLLEGRYHAAAAMTAAVSCRFHQIGDQPTDLRGTATIVISGNDLQMPPPRSAIELGERISIFWSAFILDRCWSVALGCPPSLLDDSPPASGITTPLQMKMEEYESMTIPHILGTGKSLSSFLQGRADYSIVAQETSVHLVRIVAAALFERATRFSSRHSENRAGYNASAQVNALEAVIARFNASLVPQIGQSAHRARESTRLASTSTNQSPELRRAFIVARSMGYAAIIQLHNVLAEAYTGPSASNRSYDLCLSAARQVAAIIPELTFEDTEFLDPIVGVAWLSVTRILLKEVDRLQSGEDSDSAIARQREIQADLETVTTAMDRLGTTCPLMAFQAAMLKEPR